MNECKYAPVCEQQIARKAKLTHIAFNPLEPILLIGDDRGYVQSMKLSPNLRKKIGSEEQSEKIERILLTAMGKYAK